MQIDGDHFLSAKGIIHIFNGSPKAEALRKAAALRVQQRFGKWAVYSPDGPSSAVVLRAHEKTMAYLSRGRVRWQGLEHA